MSKKIRKQKTSAVNKSLKIIASVMTGVWILLLLFPIYWMVITSLSGTDTTYQKEISFSVDVPKCYTTVVEFSNAEAEALGEDGIYLQANSILWRMFNYKKANVGKAEVVILIEDEVMSSYSLSKADFEINKGDMWTKNILKHKDIERVIQLIEEKQIVDIKTEKIKLASKGNTNEYSKEMVSDFSKDEDILGTISNCTISKSYKNLLDNYKIAWDYPNNMGIEGGLAKPIINTILVAVATILLNVIICSAAAYALSKLLPRSLGSKMQLLIMATGMVPATVTLIPKFQVIQNLGLDNSLWAIILPTCATFGAMLLFKGTFDAYPNEIMEAARIDGLGEMGIFLQLALPSAKGVIGVQILSIFATSWNDYFWPSMIIRDENNYTVSLVINYLMNIGSANFNVLLALGFLISIPTLIIYALFQKYLTYGIDFSGIKG